MCFKRLFDDTDRTITAVYDRDEITLPETSREGYTFTGWSTNSGDVVKCYDNGEYSKDNTESEELEEIEKVVEFALKYQSIDNAIFNIIIVVIPDGKSSENPPGTP